MHDVLFLVACAFHFLAVAFLETIRNDKIRTDKIRKVKCVDNTVGVEKTDLGTLDNV
jgi:hypothetical protein